MSVIVKGMKMPDCCAACKLCDYDDGGIYCNALEVFMSFDELPEGRRSDCPLEGLIRCKDCVYFEGKPNGYCSMWSDDYLTKYRTDDDYCSDAERKE